MSRTLAALASCYVGRRVMLEDGALGTITRVGRRGFTVRLEDSTTRAGVVAAHIIRYLD